ncbi:hypothetical protein CLF_111451, partial [Clonorchis sinensis]
YHLKKTFAIKYDPTGRLNSNLTASIMNSAVIKVRFDKFSQRIFNGPTISGRSFEDWSFEDGLCSEIELNSRQARSQTLVQDYKGLKTWFFKKISGPIAPTAKNDDTIRGDDGRGDV